MNRKLYEALRSIGIGDKQAADVSEAISDDIVALKQDVHLLRWMVGANLALTLVVVGKLFAG
jgi:hypothetical protein